MRINGGIRSPASDSRGHFACPRGCALPAGVLLPGRWKQGTGIVITTTIIVIITLIIIIIAIVITIAIVMIIAIITIIASLAITLLILILVLSSRALRAEAADIKRRALPHMYIYIYI